MHDTVRYLLLQVRDADDPMIRHEVECFARALCGRPEQFEIMNLFNHVPTPAELDGYDIVLLGGSGDYSVPGGASEQASWLDRALETMRELHELSKPTFASCWGFQAMALAMGGTVVTDMSRAEIGTNTINLTATGAQDPVFSSLPTSFPAQMGHQDIVDRIPDDAVLLASSDRVENQAFRFVDKPIYCTQFHPELTREKLLDRVRYYPKYVESIARMPYAEFERTCVESPEVNALLPRFVEHVLNSAAGPA